MSKKHHKYLREQPKRAKRGPAGKIVLLVILALLLAAGLLFWKYIIQNVRTEVTVEVGGSVTAQDFIINDLGIEAELIPDQSQLDLSVPGDHAVKVRYCGIPLPSKLLVRDTVAPVGTVQNMTVFSNSIPNAADFVTGVTDMTQVMASFSHEPDTALEGEQMVTIVLTDMGGNTSKYAATLTILFDETAPEILGAEERIIFLGNETGLLDGITVTDDLDTAPLLTVDDSGVDLTVPGTYDVTYTAVDASGNETTVTSTVTVIKDEEAPQLLGVRDLSVFIGSTISYRSNVIVRDDIDENPSLSIDSSKVDLSVAGTYPVVYTAKDGAGNEVSMETTITVSEPSKDVTDAETIYAAADAVLARITTSKMSDTAKVKAIYKWVLNECWYSSDCDKTDWMQAAYQMLDKGYGDCFGFYAVCRLMFERLGLPNLSVQRSPGTSRNTTHYWSMVSVDGGETFYHFDSCPHPKPARNMCLVTDSVLEWFNGHCRDYYTYDKSLYPATPEE